MSETLLHPAAIAAILAPSHPGAVTVTRHGRFGPASAARAFALAADAFDLETFEVDDLAGNGLQD
ncbi:MAG: hypothetical protein AB8B99_18755 [Phormidesmis sp.]